MIRKLLSNKPILATAFLAAVIVLIGITTAAQAQAPFAQCQFQMSAAGVSNTSQTGYCPVDPQRMTQGAGVAILVNFSSGASATATVQISGDVPMNVSGGGLWNNHDTLINLTASANGNLQYPVTGIRLNVTAYASGTITVTVVQPALPKN